MHQKLISDPFLILINKPKQPLHARNSFTNRIFWKRIIKKILKSLFFFCRTYLCVIRMPLVHTRMSFFCHSYALVCHPYVTRMYSYVIRISLVCIRMSFVYHSYVILCHPYVTRMYSYATRMFSYAIRMSLVCTCMSSVCHSYVLACHLYVTRMSSICHSYVVLPWTILHWLWMLKLCIEVQFTKFMNICFFLLWALHLSNGTNTRSNDVREEEVNIFAS